MKGLPLITNIRNNMKTCLMVMLIKRSVIETINDELKEYA
ncbi:hypothetical protein H9X96_12980 [Pedobacter sp. N36a]|nr:hypothetical protein [Pedobacter sp. N36a]